MSGPITPWPGVPTRLTALPLVADAPRTLVTAVSPLLCSAPNLGARTEPAHPPLRQLSGSFVDARLSYVNSRGAGASSPQRSELAPSDSSVAALISEIASVCCGHNLGSEFWASLYRPPKDELYARCLLSTYG